MGRDRVKNTQTPKEKKYPEGPTSILGRPAQGRDLAGVAKQYGDNLDAAVEFAQIKDDK